MPLHLLRRASPIRPVCVTYQQLLMNCNSPLLSEKSNSLESLSSDLATLVVNGPPNSCRASRRFSLDFEVDFFLWVELVFISATPFAVYLTWRLLHSRISGIKDPRMRFHYVNVHMHFICI